MKDYTSLSNPKHLHRIDRIRAFPEWVKAASIPTDQDTRGLNKQAFADTAERRLPIHTKTACFYSVLDYFSRPEMFYTDETYARLTKAAEAFDIADELTPYISEAVESMEKVAAAPAPTYAISTWDLESDTLVQALPLSDSHSLTDAAGEIEKLASQSRLPYTAYVDSCRTLVKYASEVGYKDLPGRVKAIGAEREADFEKAATLINDRKRYVSEEKFSEYLNIVKTASIDPFEACEQLEQRDYENGIADLYDLGKLAQHRLFTPHEVIFCGDLSADVEKAAATSVDLSGAIVPLDVLRGVDTAQAQHLMSSRGYEMLKRACETVVDGEAAALMEDLPYEDACAALALVLEPKHD